MKRLTSTQTVENQQVERTSNSEQQQHSETSARTNVFTAQDSTTVERRRTNNKKTQTAVSDEVVVTTTRVYDTEKPIDTLTGRPPLLRETIQARHRQDGSVATAQRTQSIESQSQKAVTQQQRDTLRSVTETSNAQSESVSDNIVQQTTVENAERRGLTGAQNALCWLGGTVLLLLVLYLIYNIIKRKIKIL